MIRWKQPGDVKAIVRLVRTQLVPLSPWQHPRDGRLHGEIVKRLRQGSTLVAARSPRSVPFGFLHLIVQDRVLFIDMLAVDASQQGRHWGTYLLARAEEHGRKKGCADARLFVDDTNQSGLRFYERRGYRVLNHLKALLCFELTKPLI
ncbi:GNAT family N-acetyltransferase [Cohnella faecalis]|uniref:GNAT family N-acetyltransferase n=1 Tax=Cohnella faecalis TaxID=2315694 RepID=UPI001314EBF5|nr:GNAT family N-acetyltransferase [Cohnella faecalis]